MLKANAIRLAGRPLRWPEAGRPRLGQDVEVDWANIANTIFDKGADFATKWAVSEYITEPEIVAKAEAQAKIEAAKSAAATAALQAGASTGTILGMHPAVAALVGVGTIGAVVAVIFAVKG